MCGTTPIKVVRVQRVNNYIILFLQLLLSFHSSSVKPFSPVSPLISSALPWGVASLASGASPDMAGTGEIKYPGRTKTSTAALQFDTGVSRARGRKTWSKITWSSRLGVDTAGQPPAHRKKKIAKKPNFFILLQNWYTVGCSLFKK